MNWKALEDVIDELPKCTKGACQAPAVRDASYRSHIHDGAVVAVQPSCDGCGGDPATDYAYAESLRQVVADMRSAGFTCWWDDGPGGRSTLAPPKRSTECK